MAASNHARTGALGRGISRKVGVPGMGILAASFVAAGALLPVVQSSSATTTGQEIRSLEMRRADLHARIQTSQVEVAALGAVDRIDREARERLGMVPAERYIYVTISQPVPAMGVPTRFLPDEEERARPSTASPWWKAALEILPLP